MSTSYRDAKDLAGAPNLGPEAKRILDFHTSNLESLEKSVSSSITAATSMPSSVNCAVPGKPSTILTSTANFNSAENYDEMVKAYVDLTALAFACDVTRSIGFSFGGGAARFAIPSKYMIPSSPQADSGDSGPQHHAWTHMRNDNPSKTVALRGFYGWYATQIALFIDKLKSTMDANGRPLMDSTLVLWTSELGANGDGGDSHSNSNIPVVMFGNSGGQFRTGRHYSAAGSNEVTALVLHQLMTSIIRHTGLTGVSGFGNRSQSGPLDWLT